MVTVSESSFNGHFNIFTSQASVFLERNNFHLLGRKKRLGHIVNPVDFNITNNVFCQTTFVNFAHSGYLVADKTLKQSELLEIFRVHYHEDVLKNISGNKKLLKIDLKHKKPSKMPGLDNTNSGILKVIQVNIYLSRQVPLKLIF